MVFSEFTTKEEFLEVLPLMGCTRGKDIFSTFKKYITDVKLLVQKLSSITADGAPAMTSKKNGFIALRVPYSRNLFHITVSYISKCYTQKQSVSFKSILITNNTLLSTSETTEVRWLSRGKILERFIMLLPQIKEFIA